MSSSQIARMNMVKQQLRTGDVLDETILELFSSIPREAFVPNEYKHFAYTDMQIQLPHQQRMLTPLEEAQILQSLHLKGHEVVLEIGTGTGYLTALLSRLAKTVISIDYFPEFTINAQKKLIEHQCINVELHTSDASRGWMDKAPYDVIVFTGAIEKLTETHRLQLLPGGKMFAIVGKEPIMQGELYELDHKGNWTNELLFETSIPLLIDKLKTQEFVF